MPLFTALITSRTRRSKHRRCLHLDCPPSYPLFFVSFMNTTVGQCSSMPSSNGSPSNSHVENGRSLKESDRSFKERRAFDDRRKDVDEITRKHPHKIPLVIEKARNEKYLPVLDKTKFLVPEELTMSQLTAIIRKRMQLKDTQAFYLIVNRKAMVSTSMTLMEVYRSQKDEDGFLYMTYASQEVFG